jgi:hypothetical protein
MRAMKAAPSATLPSRSDRAPWAILSRMVFAEYVTGGAVFVLGRGLDFGQQVGRNDEATG